MDKITYSVVLDGETYRMSSRRMAVKSAEANQTGGVVVGSDGSRQVVTHKTPAVVRYQSSPLDDANWT